MNEDFEKMLDKHVTDEAAELEDMVSDWDDLGQLINALKTGRVSTPKKLVDAFKKKGVVALKALIQAYAHPELRDYSHWVMPYVMGFGVDAYSFLVEALDDDSSDVRINAVKTLTNFRGDEVVETFVSLLENTEPEIRQEALTYLKDNGGVASRDIFIGMLENDSDKYVRYTAASALAMLGDERSLEVLAEVLTGPETGKPMKMEIMKYLESSTSLIIKDALVFLLKDEDMVIRGNSVKMLAKMNAVELADTFLAMLENEEPYTQTDAIDALGMFKYHKAADRLLKILHDRLDDEFSVDRSVWLSASTALAELQDERAIIPMLKILHDQDKYESRIVLDAVVRFGEKALWPAINELKNSASGQVTANALEVLEELQDMRGLGPALELLEDERDFVRRSVYYAVESICKKNRSMPIKNVLLSFLGDEQIAEKAKEFIRSRCKEGGLNILLNEMEHAERSARKNVHAVLQVSEDKLLTIIELLNNRDINIRKEAVRSLGEMTGPEAASVLMSVLGDSNWEVREEVITALGKMKESRAVSRLAEMMESSRESTQQRIIVALGEIGTDDAIWIILIAYTLVHLDGYIDSTIKKIGISAVPQILKIMDNPGVAARMYCFVYILGELKAKEAVPKLQQLLNYDKMSIIHEYVEKALVKIGAMPEKKENKEGNSEKAKMTSFMSFETFKKLND